LDASDPGVRVYTTHAAAKAAHAPNGMAGTRVQLKSPVIIEGSKGLAEFAKKVGLKLDTKFGDKEAQNKAITEAALNYAKSAGHDGVVFTEKGVPQQVIDMTKWKKDIGEAAQNALKYHRENIGAANSTVRRVQQSVEQSNPDNIIDNALDKKGAVTAQNYYNALDDKGRAALRVNTIQRAINQATD